MTIDTKAVIFGIKTYSLTKKERIFFKKTKPWGIILFSRNIKNIVQLKYLIDDIKKIFNDVNFPILVDQEGGRVSRINRIIDLNFFSQHFFGQLFKKDKKLFYIVYKIYIDKVCDILQKVGININTVPVLDVRRANSSIVIGDRSFSYDSNVISKIGKICVDLYKKNKIATVVKHIPGHGMAKVDSHKKTPKVSINKKILHKKDFKPFKLCKSEFAMTAHVVYSNYDNKNTATHSKLVINRIIRKHIKFNGILISDDISMKSLQYNLEKNAILALDAGCNLVLHCNGRMAEMKKLSKVIPKIDNFTRKKTSHFYKFLR